MTEQAPNEGANANSPEKIGQFVTREWVDNKRIVHFRLYSITRDAIDEWINSSRETFLQWPAHEPILIVHDFTESGALSLTPYIRKRATELANVRPELMGRAAIVFPRTIGAQAAKIFVLISLQKHRVRRVFFTVDEALGWLRNSDAE